MKTKIKITTLVMIGISLRIYTQIVTSELKVEQTNNETFILGNVGIGTSNPDPNSGLHMYQNRYTLYGPNTSWGAYLQVGGNGRTTEYASVAATNGNLHLDSQESHNIYLNHYSKGNTFLNTQSGNVGIGTSNPDPNHKLEVNGTIKANILKSNAHTWPDFVFENNYELPSLKNVEKHIKLKGHLRGIPSTSEIQKNGINLGEMDAKLLQKIEELTLYTIEQEKKIDALEKQNSKIEQQQKKIEKLESLVQKLLKDKN